jgi:hypothetical protein
MIFAIPPPPPSVTWHFFLTKYIPLTNPNPIPKLTTYLTPDLDAKTKIPNPIIHPNLTHFLTIGMLLS